MRQLTQRIRLSAAAVQSSLAIGAAYGFGVPPSLPLAALGLVATSFAHPLLGLCFSRQVRDE